MQKVKRLTHVNVHERGISIVAEFDTEAGLVVLDFEPATLETAMGDLAAALRLPQVRQTQAMMGAVAAAEPARSRVAPDDDGNVVLLSFQMPNGLEHHFALPNRKAAQIGHQLQQAAKTRKRPSGTAH